jgi:hypothetical protein
MTCPTSLCGNQFGGRLLLELQLAGVPILILDDGFTQKFRWVHACRPSANNDAAAITMEKLFHSNERLIAVSLHL